MKRDIYRIAALSFGGVALLFLTFVGSVRGFLVVSVPPLAGILVATSAGLLVFGRLDGLTMVFGASLMGIAMSLGGMGSSTAGGRRCTLSSTVAYWAGAASTTP